MLFLRPFSLVFPVCPTGKLTVDGDSEVTGEASGDFVGLDLDQPLYIGGVPDFSQIHRENGFTQGFTGECPSPAASKTVPEAAPSAARRVLVYSKDQRS